jgi:hypothetical protein
MCAAAVQTIAYARHSRRFHTRSGAQCEYPLQRWPRILQFLHLLLWSTVTTFRKCFCPKLWGYDAYAIVSLYRNRGILGAIGIFHHIPNAILE